VSGVDELVAFVRRCLDEDEHWARAAFGDHNRAIAEWHVRTTGIVEIGQDEDDLVTYDRDVAYHIERWDPARVLAEVKAKRRILEEVQSWLEVDDEHDPVETAFRASAGWMVAVLAQPYAGQDGWREEWQLSAPA
jgi:hypothetical protein